MRDAADDICEVLAGVQAGGPYSVAGELWISGNAFHSAGPTFRHNLTTMLRMILEARQGVDGFEAATQVAQDASGT